MLQCFVQVMNASDRQNASRTLLTLSLQYENCQMIRQQGTWLLSGSFVNVTGERAAGMTTGLTVFFPPFFLGFIPMVIDLIHDQGCGISQSPRLARRNGSQVLHNIVHRHPDDKKQRREASVLRCLEQIRTYSDSVIYKEPFASMALRMIRLKCYDNHLPFRRLSRGRTRRELS